MKSQCHGFQVTYHHGWPWVYFKSIRTEVEPFFTNSVEPSNSLLDGPLSDEEFKNNKQWNQLEKATEATWAGRAYDSDQAVAWRMPDRWQHFGYRQRLDIRGLILNFLFVLTIAAIPAAFFESRIRSGILGWRLRIIDVLILTALVASAVVWLPMQTRSRYFSDLIESSQICDGFYADTEFGRTLEAPIWAMRLFGRGRFEAFKRINALSINEYKLEKIETQDVDEFARAVRTYGKIRTVDVVAVGPRTQGFITRIGPLERVRIWAADADKDEWRTMAAQNGWKRLTFEN